MSVTADAVVVGGGIVGTSAAFHLASRGAKRVVLCERRGLAAGASGRSAAFIQMHMRTAPEARLCALSMPYWLRWKELVGVGGDVFVRTGYLRVESPANARKLRANVEMLREAGINTQLIAPDDVRRLAPYLRAEDVAGGAYEPDGGYAKAVNATLGFAHGAQQLGVEIMMGAEVIDIVSSGGQVSAVETTHGHIGTRVVIVAAGAWSVRLLSRLGMAVDVERARAQVAAFVCAMPPNVSVPLAIMDGVRQVYYRPDGPGRGCVLVGIGAGGRRPLPDLDTYDEGVDADYARICCERFMESAPRLTDVRFIGGRAGPVNITADRAPVIDEYPEAAGLFYVLDSGRNFKTAPAIGHAIAEWALEGASRVADLRPFRASRFVEGDLLIGPNEYEDPTEDFHQMQSARGGVL